MRISPIDEMSTYLFHQGTNCESHRIFGAHFTVYKRQACVRFAVWAPHVQGVSVVGDWNGWDPAANPMQRLEKDGEIWVAYVPGLREGMLYKDAITAEARPDGSGAGRVLQKADPYAFTSELRPGQASKLTKLNYKWHDAAWQKKQRKANSQREPMLTYEVHLGSWRRGADGRVLSYREVADQLAAYVRDMHYTHVELLPLCEYPYDGSWGYQGTGYFAPTSRYGSPQDLMYLVDTLHQAGVGVILDWVPGHFCKDAHGLRHFNGQTLYESGNEVLAENREWDTMNFDYGRPEVRSFLISSALYWLGVYHLDGLRIDAVANMLYLDFGRKLGEWQPNKYGGNQNLEAIDFIHMLNQAVAEKFPHAVMIAEESSAFPGVTQPVAQHGLGFTYKWNMGWMNDLLEYMAMDPIYRKWHQNKLTFSFMYANAENYVLPLSHDEVVHGKRSLVDKMPGDNWRKFAGLRAFYGYWMAHPGKKLLFMGGEFGQYIEWREYEQLEWFLTERFDLHRQMLDYSRELNGYYVAHPEMWQGEREWGGYNWISCDDRDNSVIAFTRTAEDGARTLVVCNFTPEVRVGYRIGAPAAGVYREVFNSDELRFGGSGVTNDGELFTLPEPMHGFPQCLELRLPPLATIYLKLVKPAPVAEAAPVAETAQVAEAEPVVEVTSATEAESNVTSLPKQRGRKCAAKLNS